MAITESQLIKDMTVLLYRKMNIKIFPDYL
jgi:hypothetical protein